jgi:hypothetical protein
MVRLQKKDILEKKLITWISKKGEARNVGLTARAKSFSKTRPKFGG